MMKSVGQIIKDTRLRKNLTIDDLERITKIKRSFLVSLEKQNWAALPNYSVLQGFVRLVGHALDEDENRLVAFLRRDYPPQNLPVNPKPDIADKFRWTPKMTFFLGLIFLVLVIVGYLAYQYFLFITPPKLVIDIPPEGFKAENTIIQISGRTSQDATVKVNNQPFIVDKEGKFSGEIVVTPETREIEIKATSRPGKETTVKRNIEVKLD